jgi:ParB family chromosome partitioning protein
MAKSALDRLRDGQANRLCREALGERSTLSPAAAPPATPPPAAADPEAGWTRDRARGVVLLELARIVPDPNQPRSHFDADELERLAASVRARGIMQPVRVRWDGERWVLIAGERRYRAALAAELASIPAMRIDGLPTEADVLEDQIAEQLLRAAWSPVEEAKALRCLGQMRGWENYQICKALHLSASNVSRSLALLELAEEVQALVDGGQLAARAAIELRKLAPEQQRTAAAAIVADGLTVEQTAQRVAELRGTPTKAPRIPHVKRVLRVDGGTVTVKLASGAIGDAEVLAALDEAANDLRRSARAAA